MDKSLARLTEKERKKTLITNIEIKEGSSLLFTWTVKGYRRYTIKGWGHLCMTDWPIPHLLRPGKEQKTPASYTLLSPPSPLNPLYFRDNETGIYQYQENHVISLGITFSHISAQLS